MRRVLFRALLVAGGTVAGTAAAWALTTGSASADPATARPAADVAAAAPAALNADTARPPAARSDALPGLPGHLRDASRATGRSGARAGEGLGLPQAVPWHVRQAINPAHRHLDRPRPSTGPLIQPSTGATTGPVAGPSRRPEVAPVTDAETGALASPIAGVLAGLASAPSPARWLRPQPDERPGLGPFTGSLSSAFTGVGDRLGGGTGGPLGHNPIGMVRRTSQLVAGQPTAPAGSVDTWPADPPVTSLLPAAAGRPADTAAGSPPHRARTTAPSAARHSVPPAQPSLPLTPSGPPAVAPISGCACGQQGPGSPGGQAVATTTTDAASLPGTAVAHASRPRSQREMAAPGNQPGVTPD